MRDARYEYRVQQAVGNAAMLEGVLAELDAAGWEPFAILPYKPALPGDILEQGLTHVVCRRPRDAAASGVRADELAERLPPRHDPALADVIADIKADPDAT